MVLQATDKKSKGCSFIVENSTRNNKQKKVLFAAWIAMKWCLKKDIF